MKTMTFLKGHISKKIPPDMGAPHYVGFMPPNTWEFPMNLLSPTEWGASSSRNRYGLEKTGMVE